MKYYGIAFLLLTACVSVSIEKPRNSEKAKNYSMLSPSEPFQLKDKEPFDKFWLHPKNGNSISLQTACGPNDPRLSQLSHEALLGIEDLAELERDRFRYNGRGALETIHTGRVDGIEIKIATLVFKKNHCNYTLNYFGLKKYFDSNWKDYQAVKKNLRVK
mgnify:CR=1 FL=1|tara:strand:- start:11863 stop:12342 length:480 start_codon:yes stop_codon:yes gene_type:complete